VSGLFDSKDTFDPANNFVGRRVGRFVEINDTVTEMLFESSCKRGRSCWKRSVMGCSDVKFVVVLEQKWPLGRIEFGC